MKLFLIFIQLDLKFVEEYRLTPTDVMGILFSASVFWRWGWRICMLCVSSACGSTAVLHWNNIACTITWWLKRAILKPDLIHMIAACFHLLLSRCSFCSLACGRHYLEKTLGKCSRLWAVMVVTVIFRKITQKWGPLFHPVAHPPFKLSLADYIILSFKTRYLKYLVS